MLIDTHFWISSLLLVVLSLYIIQIDPLVQIFFGGYLNFINGSIVIGNPIFVSIFIFAISRIFGPKFLDFYIQFFVNANIIWIEAFPALYLNKFYDIKLIIIGFCILDILLASYFIDKIRHRLIK